MSFFSKQEVVLASPFEATLTLNGKPAAGAKVVRSIEWQEKPHSSQEAITDSNGYFSLPIVKDTWRSTFLNQFVSAYHITVNYNHHEYTIWVSGKVDESLYGELGGKPDIITCELSQDRQHVEGARGVQSTSCQWNKLIVENN